MKNQNLQPSKTDKMLVLVVLIGLAVVAPIIFYSLYDAVISLPLSVCSEAYFGSLIYDLLNDNI